MRLKPSTGLAVENLPAIGGLAMTSVLVIGATGLIGRPVAERLLADGRRVRVLVRDQSRARRLLGRGFDYVEGDIRDRSVVARALHGCHAVHVSVAGGSAAEMSSVETAGTATVAEAAAAARVRLLTYVSGNLVRETYGPRIAEHQAKIAAEDAIRASGVPYVIFRPTYFMDSLPRHVQGSFAVTIGRPQPLHMVAASDFGAMVSRAYDLPKIADSELAVYGPEPVTIQEALRHYRDIVQPSLRCLTVPIPAMAAANGLFMGGKLSSTLQLMRLLERVGERGDPSDAWQLLGAPTTTVREWCERQALIDAATARGA
jgi:uncharacterized protein YbjT (DUF2867 family)